MFKASEVFISGDVFHHIFDVCRQELGSKFEVLGDGQKAHLVKITELGKKSARGQIIESRELPVPRKPHLVLALSVSRFPVMEAVVEKAVELGVSRIEPFFSEYSFIRKALPENKIERWNKIVVSATQQSGRGDLMEITPANELEQVLEKFNQSPSAKGLFAYEGQSTLSIKKAVKEQTGDMEEFWIFVGSEGGFSRSEVEIFKRQGLEPVTLGEQVLRVETACIALLAILKYEFGHRA
jgi:16S rRNA (uracil1498-N3)-methyltransferase